MLLSFLSHSAASPTSASTIVLLARARAGFFRLPVSSSSSSAAANDDARVERRRPSTTPRRRTRGSGTSSDHLGGGVPSLADFVHRAKVLRQYRNFVRLARFVDARNGGGGRGGIADDDKNNAGGDGCLAALDEVRLSYRVKMRTDMDAISRNMAYSEGEHKLREIGMLVGYSAGDRSFSSSATPSSSQSYDTDSWINIQDEEDRRGRVGVQWPWQRVSATPSCPQHYLSSSTQNNDVDREDRHERVGVRWPWQGDDEEKSK
ncbi:hypothetical protein ACHAW5_004586 [Stephanodiscus triporus]|uniref:Uncharacterized protein n=1 Tax=Stephanodiscus triporus TaxID=2934178 RepID=A0ABD3QAP0_9STRA